MTIGVLALCFLCGAAPAQAKEASQDSERGRLDPILLDGWQYRWGDSPIDDNGMAEWLRSDEPTGDWEDIPSLTTPPGADDQNFAWYRIRLPQDNWPNTALYFPTVAPLMLSSVTSCGG